MQCLAAFNMTNKLNSMRILLQIIQNRRQIR